MARKDCADGDSGGAGSGGGATASSCACVAIGALPLQLALRAHPGAVALAVLDRAGAQGRVLHASRAARACGVAPGQLQAQALALCPELRVSPCDTTTIAGAVAELVRVLSDFSPAVEPARPPIAPGVFWLDTRGLRRLYPRIDGWAAAVRAALHARALRATVVVGRSRFGSYAVARSLAPGQLRVLGSTAEERRAIHDVPLAKLDLPDELGAQLARLGVTRVGGFLALPRAGLRRRFGAEAAALHDWAAGGFSPVRAVSLDEPVQVARVLDEPVREREAIWFLCKQLLAEVLADLRARGQTLEVLTVRLVLRDAATREDASGGARTVDEVLRPAESARSAEALLELLRLRSEGWRLADDVREIALRAEGRAARPDQLALFDERGPGALVTRPRRARAAAERALARVRARLGEQAVVVAELRDGILPEARFAWRPLATLSEQAFRPAAQAAANGEDDEDPDVALAAPGVPDAASDGVTFGTPGGSSRVSTRLVRRYFTPAVRLPDAAGAGRHDDGWLLAGVIGGAVERLDGPYVVSGGWWRAERRRDYHFATLRSGRRLWVYFDRVRRGWYLHGVVE